MPAVRILAVRTAGTAPTLAVPPAAPPWLAPGGREAVRLSFGLRSVDVAIRVEPDLPAGTVAVTGPVAGALRLPLPVRLGLFPVPDQGLRLGPLVGLLVAEEKLERLRRGEEDTVYHRYLRYMDEVGGLLCFFSVFGVEADPAPGCVRGYVAGAEGWQERLLPLPRVVYDRCFGTAGRSEALRMRELAARTGITVVNRPVKIAKLEAFRVLAGDPELRAHLPDTHPLTAESLAACAERYDLLYLKPDTLYKGQGIVRMERCGDGWAVRSSEEQGGAPPAGSGAVRLLRGPGEVLPLLRPGVPYLVQEGLRLATYLGNAYDFRSLVQRDGGGRWQVTGLVARIAPEGGVVTSPRSGGLVSPAERVLAHSFGRAGAKAILAAIERVSVRIAAAIDREMGPCVELGLDLGVTADGAVRLIEVNGKPLKVSLTRLADPGVTARIHRFPIHAAAALDCRAGTGGDPWRP